MAAVISSFVEIIFRAIDQLSDQAHSMVGAMRDFRTETVAAAQAAKDHVEETGKLGISMRGVALDLRMISIAIAIFRREVGTTNPIVDMLSRGLLVLSTAATATIASIDLLQKYNVLAAGGFASLAASAKSALASIAAFVVTHPILILIAALAAAVIALGFAFSDQAITTRAYRSEMESLEKTIEDAENALKGLRLEMEELQIQNAALRIQEMEIQHAIAMRGFATEEEGRTIDALTIAESYLNYELAKQALHEKTLQHEANLSKAQLDAINKDIQSRPAFGFDLGGRIQDFFWQLFGGQGESPLKGFPRAPWAPWAPPGQAGFYSPPSITSRDLARMGGGFVSIAISFPHATFATGIDIESAIKRGAAEAAIEVRRQL